MDTGQKGQEPNYYLTQGDGSNAHNPSHLVLQGGWQEDVSI